MTYVFGGTLNLAQSISIHATLHFIWEKKHYYFCLQ